MNSETKKLCGEILQKLLKKYDKRSAKQIETNRRITLSPSEIYKAYHGLWRIEESFKIMKSYLEMKGQGK